MNTLILPTRRLVKTLILVLLTSILMATTALAEDAPKAGNGDKDKVVRQIVDNWIQIGTEQYKRGFYAAAEKSFMRAKDYEESLTAEERTKLNESLQMAHKAAVEQEAASVAKQSASEPAVQQPVTESAVEQPKEQAAVEVNKVAEPAPAVAVDTASEVVVTTPAAKPEQEQGYIGVINQRTNIIRSRVKAVVNDSAAKAEGFIGQGQFDKAREAVEVAERVVYENQQQLGDYLFNQYSGQLKQLSERIADGQKKQAQQKEDEKRMKAEQSQQEHKEQMSADREKRINDLFQNTLSFQKQHLYEEAIGQLEMLLAIDPQNNQALILKQTLEDMVSFRKQLEIEKEKGKEKVNIMMKTDEAAIPYADEMTYPKTWREIIAKPTRLEPEAVGQDPANAAVEKQLDEIISLPGFSPEMQLREAINLIKNSVSPALDIAVNWGDLYNNANIDQTTPINMDPQTSIRLRTALDLLLQSVSAGVARLGYVVRDGVVNVATLQSLPNRMEPRVYDVTIYVGRPADYYVSAAGGGGQGGGGQGGGGQGGGGQGGGGQGGGQGGYYAEYFEETEEELDRETLRDEALERMDNLITLIQETIEPLSWYINGGEATITAYESKKLVVLQTPENHREIDKLLRKMREALGHQVSIEARFLVVGENFLEEIGLDSFGNLYLGKFGMDSTMQWRQDSFEMAEPAATGLSGGFDIAKNTVSFPPGATTDISQGAMMGFFGGRFGGVLDGLEANFLIRATQAHQDSESLVAPKVTVLSGESATLQVRRTIRYASPPNMSYNTLFSGTGGTGGVTGGIGGGGSSLQNQISTIPTGPTLNITPTITPDRKHVLLNIVAELWDFLGFDTSVVDALIPSNGVQPTVVVPYRVTLPQTERSRVKTRVSVPDGGTLLLGGLKRTAAAEKEVGVPVLSKIPIIGRIFTNRSKIADQKILLILVKPTIILQEEADAEAVAAMESQ